MKYNHILNTPEIHKVTHVQIMEIGAWVIFAVLFLILGIPRIYPNATYADLGDLPLVQLTKWLFLFKLAWGFFNIRFLSKNTIHWYRFI